MTARFGVVRFPGSNCDQDAYYSLRDAAGQEVEYLWHDDQSLKGCDVIIIPGGFSYGDYLRCGAIARFSPVMQQVVEFAKAGGIVIGICNGFQILCEAGLLPGVLMRNEKLRFVCKHVPIRVENNRTPLTSQCREGQTLSIPVAHGEGRYVCDDVTLDRLRSSGQIIFRYADRQANPNGSMDDIAGIANETFNVFGMMPHPERACDPALGSRDGLALFRSVSEHICCTVRSLCA